MDEAPSGPDRKECKVVVLLMDDRGIPKTIDQRMAIAQVLFARLTKMSIPPITLL